MSLERRLRDLESRVDNMVRAGIVSAAYADGTARVLLEDTGLVTDRLPILYPRARTHRDQWTLTAGEQVLCVFLPVGLSAGFILGAFYSRSQGAPTDNADLRVIAGADVRIGAFDAPHPVVLGDNYQILFNNHTHATPVGPSGPALEAGVVVNPMGNVLSTSYPHLSGIVKVTE